LLQSDGVVMVVAAMALAERKKDGSGGSGIELKDTQG
jgi:hypothetical protein